MTSTSDEVGHTATPWYRYGNVLVGPHGETLVTAHKGISFDFEANDLAEGNAEFVLRAANSHDSLVKALEDVMDGFYKSDGSLDAAMKQARAALSQAKGEK